jgi:hypothetical protein
MNLKDAIANVNKDPSNDGWASPSLVADALGLSLYYYNNSDRLKKYWINHWLCTDTYVGLAVYFLDDEPIGVSYQSGRKYPEEFEWLSQEAVDKTFSFLVTLFIQDDNIIFADLEKDIAEY